MEHFKVFFSKAQVLCLILILSQPSTNGDTMEGSLPDMQTVFKMLQTFLSPYISSFNNSDKPKYRTGEDNLVEKVIREKMASMKPFLQDDDQKPSKNDESDNLTLEDKDQTTIIEFVTNENKHGKKHLRNQINLKAKPFPLKDKLEKYKELRHKIKAALIKEHVSRSTLTLVTNTLDGMMTRIIENRCTWRKSYDKHNKTQKIPNKTFARAIEWNKNWNDLKKHYLKLANSKQNTSIPVELFYFFENFHEFLTHIVKDFKMFNDHSITCHFTKKNSTHENNKKIPDLRQSITTKKIKKYKCENFRICSEELSDFLNSFYYYLNDTSVSALKNYASMYIKDTDDSQEKESVVSAVNNISVKAERKTRKIFIKETANFGLNDTKDKNANIKSLRNYIKNTIDKTKTNIKDILRTGLKSLRNSLLETVKLDLSVNLDVDLNNLERDFKSRICTVFSVCNGQYTGRRRGDDTRFKNRNSVYVKVQLDLDDELKEAIARPRSAVFYNKSEDLITDKKSHKKKHLDRSTKMYRKSIANDFDEYAKVNVTRTTIISSTTPKISTTTVNKTDKNSTTTVATKKDNL